jgi:hypothetical protein
MQGTGNDGRWFFKYGGEVSTNAGGGAIFVSQGDLFGWYKLFKGGPLEIHMEGVHKGGSGDMWRAYGMDQAIGKYSNDDPTDPNYKLYAGGFAGFWDGDFGVDFAFDKLHFGVRLPNVFNGASSLVDDSFMKLVFGATFSDPLFNFAMNFGVENYQVYFGAETTIAEVVALGLAFYGVDNGADYVANAALKAGYSNDSFGFGTEVGVGVTPNFKFGLFPWFNYKVLPSNLWFGINAGFLFDFADPDNAEVYWKARAAIGWNFNNSGAEEEPQTGMRVWYEVNKDVANYLGVQFRWGLW